jgi:hypothetical protein
MDRANKAAEVFMKHKIEKVEERLNSITNIVNKNVEVERNNINYLLNKITELQEQVDKLTQQRERFQHNLMYVEVVEDVISTKETEWENKTFNNMLVKLVGKDEVYKVFVQTSNAPVIGSKIKFTFNADENKLSLLKLI